MALRDCEGAAAADPVDAAENANEVKKTDSDERRRSRKRAGSDSQGSEDHHHRHSKRRTDSDHSDDHRHGRRSSDPLDDHRRSSRRSDRSSRRRRDDTGLDSFDDHRRGKDRDEEDDKLCKTYRTYRRSSSRHHYRSSRRPSRSISRSKSPARSEPRAAGSTGGSSKFDVLPMPQVQATGNSFTFSLPQIPLFPQLTKPARKIYVGGLPPFVNEAVIAEFFNRVMADIQGNPGNAVVHVYINRDKNYAFVEMRSVEEASNAMALDGINFNGVSVKVRRPADYRPEHAGFGPSQPSAALRLDKVGLVSPNERIFIGGLPYDWTDDQVRSVLEPFGALRSFDVIKDPETRRSKGYGFVVFQDGAATDRACAALNDTQLLGKTLRVHRASLGNSNAMMAAAEIGTKVICLRNAVSEELLKDDAEFSDIMEDMREECGKYGQLESVEIPREGPGMHKVFLEYKDLASAFKARHGLHGRTFDQRTVQATYYSQDKFAARDFGG